MKIILIRFINSPFYIQRFINRTLKAHNDHYRTFIDDIVIFSDIFNDHIEHLEDIFSLFREKNISINPKKFYIRYSIVELLRYYIDVLKMYSIEDRIQSFYKLEFLFILKTLETYLKVIGFLRSIILYYIQIADSLQKYKVEMFIKGREEGRIIVKNQVKRTVYINSIHFEPISKKRALF